MRAGAGAGAGASGNQDLDELDSLSDFDDMESVSDSIMTDPSGADVSTVSAWTATGTATINQQDLARIDQQDQELELTNNTYAVSTSWMFDDDNVSLPDTDTRTVSRTRTLHHFDFDQYDQPRSALKTKTKTK